MAIAFSCTALIAAALLPLILHAQDPYAFLKAKDYSRAVLAFEAGLQTSPQNVALRKDYAYTLLKVGDDVVKENFELAMNEAKEYTFVAKMKKGNAKLSIAFTNDAYKENEFDRNLYIHKVKLELKK